MKTSDIFYKLQAATEEDILLHFPKRYDDLTPSDLTYPLVDYSKVIIKGQIGQLVSLQGGKIIRLTLNSSTYNQEVKAVIFGQPFYLRVLKKRIDYVFIGVYKEKQKAVMISQALKEDSLLVQNRYKPFYALPHDISQSSFYNLIRDILDNRTDYINEVLPSYLIKKYKLEERLAAFKDVHIPVSYECINRGLRVFKYEEALKYCLYSLYLKNDSSLSKKKEIKIVPKDLINSFILHLPYKLTPDQVVAIREIITDMDSSVVMNRMLQGDVGSGKTIVAFIALYANCLRGGQGVLMAPTTTLAHQHYLRAVKIFKGYPVQVAELDNLTSDKENKEVLKQIESGIVNFVVGTHSVFSDNVVYNNLSLVVTDEQHKFGVEQREKIVSKGNGVDSLSMSATPIPRTLSMMINSDMDVSSLDHFPFKQREVITKRVNSLDPLIDKAIQRALDIKKQVFIVAPKIEENEKSSRLSAKAVYEEIKSKYGEDNVSLLTGRVKKSLQEAIYKDFSDGSKLILVSTSLIEVGVDVKNAALMIIYEANYFGLASLHQLRGRIGRSGEGAMALLVYDGDDVEAIDKLDYLSAHSDGEDIARYDLAHRGSGDLLSNHQSGDSILHLANFVTDFKVFECAKQDAGFILKNLVDSSNKSYLDYVLRSLSKDN